MAVFSLLTMLDDIATILDDVSLMTKVAAKKTAGVLGDDLALNAQQVSGVNPDRELPVVWAVAKGSAINKMILVPTALAISAFAPWAVTPLLMVGGLYLCYEGVEKLAHKLLHSKEEDAAHHAQELQAVADPTVDLVAFEKEKIKGAVRTDFILSAEIITIALGTVATAPILQQVLVLAGIAAIMTVGVYGLVAGIVKLDDGGLRLIKSRSGALRAFGRGILSGTPYLMKGLSIAGTAAMFMVGGSIIMHGIPVAHHAIEDIAHRLGAMPAIGGLLEAITPVLLGTLGGIVAGVIALIVVKLGSKIFKLEPATSGSPGSHH